MFELFGSVASIPSWWFLAILLLVFALFLVLAGIFTAYFGSGKSRTIGVVLLVVGLVVGVLVGYLFSLGTLNGGIKYQLLSLVWVSFEIVVAAIIGALIAIGIFLVAIMKS